MTPEQQRIAIAEACGLAPHPDNPNRDRTSRFWSRQYSGGVGPIYSLNGPVVGEFPLGSHHQKLPDYLNDLNSMHEAEKRLRTPQGNESDSIAEDRMIEYAERLNYCIDATAAQRAEAFLRTLNLWTP